MKVWPKFIGRYRPGRLGRNTLYGSAGLGFRAVLQAAYLLLLSRWLGPQGYGLFAGSVALMMLAAPMANWGSGLLLTRHVASDRSLSRGMWATALMQTGVAGGLLTLTLMLVSAFALHERVGLGGMLLLALSELVLLPVIYAATSECFALEHGRAAAVVICLAPVGRVLAVATLVVCNATATPANAAVAHCAGSLVGFAITVVLIVMVDGWPEWGKRLRLRRAMRQGTAYALGGAVGTSYREVDKVLMLQLLGAVVVGPYTAGFRVVSVFVLPVSALIGATLPRLMALRGTPGRQRTYKAVVLASLGLGLAASAAAAMVAPWVPYIFGLDYAAMTRYVLLLSPWPLLFALHQCTAANLTAVDRQGMRVVVEGAGLLLVIAINFAFLRRLGAETSVLALLLAEAAMALGCWIAASTDRSVQTRDNR